MISARCRINWRSSSCAAFTTCCAEMLLACASIACKPSRLFFPTSINASSSKQTMTRIFRLSSNTEKDPPKFHHELDSFGEERLSEKRSGSCGADTLVRELCKYSRTTVSDSPTPPADKSVRATQRPSASSVSLAHHGSVLGPDFVHHANLSRLRVRILID